ncbi:hypothetical protein LCGC14_2448940 [marine sediment metagenome]|uniref:DUF4177 domain-containing protein n=1 Tax=marine sediment metagenome TaxID=412755 RepID=A0A0F9BH11_9ZZZZ
MTKWEYNTYWFIETSTGCNKEHQTCTQWLNARGDEGWEAVQCNKDLSGEFDQMGVLFKRPVEATTA